MKRKIITICGSMKFEGEMKRAIQKFSLEGSIVLAPVMFSDKERKNLNSKELEALNELHANKVCIADEVYVVDVDGYIGESTKKEIECAKKLKIKIKYYSKEEPKRKTGIKKFLTVFGRF